MPDNIIDNRYEILDRLGEGGMGTVYNAKDLKTGDELAIKFIHFNTRDLDAIKRFQAEYQTLIKLRHKNIVTVYDMNVTGQGEYYITMEFIKGKTLRAILDEQTHIEIDAFLDIFIQVIEGLAYAHENNVIHCDIKPENIVIEASNLIKIMDFGLAENVSDGENKNEKIKGTIAYMSPEQSMGEVLNIKTDLYSLGIVMYETFSGRLPFLSNDSRSILQAHRNNVSILNTDYSNIPDELVGIIKKLLEKNPNDRYDNANDLKKDLDKIRNKSNDKQIIHLFSTAMVGRDEEFKTLNQTLNDVRAGKGRIIFIRGESGIGKTRLIQELIKYGRKRKVQALKGACNPSNIKSYDVFAKCLKNSIQNIGMSVNINKEDFEILKNIGRELIAILPDILDESWLNDEIKADNNTDNHTNGNINKQQSFMGIIKFLKYISTKNPLILFIDDLEFIDKDSLELLEYLADNIDNTRILICGAYRDEDIQNENNHLIETIEKLSGYDIFSQLKLQSLNLESVTEMIKQMLGDTENIPTDFYHKILAETSGNPLYIENVIQEIVDDRQVILLNDKWQLSSENIDDITFSSGILSDIENKLDELSTEEKEILLKSLVLGEQINFDILRNILNLSNEKLINALNNFVEKRFIQKEEINYRFYHRKIRDQLNNLLSDDIKKSYHKEIADALVENEFDDNYLIAKHYFEAGEYTKVLKYAGLAYNEAKQNFHEHIIVNCLQWILYIANNIEEIFSDISKLEELSGISVYDIILTLVSNYQKAGEHYKLIDLINNSLENKHFVFSQHERSKLTIKMSTSLRLTGQSEKAIEIITELKDRISNTDDKHIYAHALQELSHCILSKNKINEALELLLEAKEIFESEFNNRHIGFLYIDISNIYWLKSDLETFITWVEKAGSRFEDIEDPLALGVYYNRRGNYYVMKTENDEAVKNYKKAIEYFDKAAADLEKAKINNNIGIIYSRYGDPEKAKYYTLNAYKLFKKARQKHMLALCSGNLIKYYLDEYDFENTERLLKEIDELYKEINITHELHLNHINRAILYLTQKKYEDAIAEFSKGCDIAKEANSYESILLGLLGLSRTYLYLNNIEEAKKYFNESKEYLPEKPTELDRGQYIFTKAEILKYEGDFEEADNYYKQSIEIYDEVDIVEKQRILLTYGKFLKEQNKSEDAKNALTEARNFFARNNMNKRLSEVNEILDEIIDSEKTKRDKYLSSLHKEINEIGNESIKEKIHYITFEINRLGNKVRELNQLLEVNNNIGSVLDIKDLLNLVLDKILDVTRGERGFILLIEKVQENEKEISKMMFKAGRKSGYKNLSADEYNVSSTIIKNVIKEKKPIIVEDTLEDTYYSLQKSIIELDIKAVMAIPLLINKKVMGLIYIDNIFFQRNLYKENLELVKGLTNQAVISLQNARLYGQIKMYNQQLEDMVIQRTQQLLETNLELEEKNRQMINELNIATGVQKGILPQNLPDNDLLSVAVKFEPMVEVSGDYYDVFQIDENTYAMLVADVSGHGVPSALITCMAKIAFVNFTEKELTTSEICSRVNNNLFINLEGGEFYLTAFFAIIDFEKMKMQYTAAGHPSARLYKKDSDELIKLDCKGFLIGITENAEYDYKEIDIAKNDRIVIYSDGIVEARNNMKDFFGEARLDSAIREYKDLNTEDFKDMLFVQVIDFCSTTSANDDRTLLVADIK